MDHRERGRLYFVFDSDCAYPIRLLEGRGLRFYNISRNDIARLHIELHQAYLSLLALQLSLIVTTV